MEIHPIRLYGGWDIGWALDMHTLSSVYIGDDPFGNPMFDTIRSDIGSLVYRLEYRGDFTVAQEIINVALHFLEHNDLLGNIDLVLPAPPIKARITQPAFVIAEGIASSGKIPYTNEALSKILRRNQKMPLRRRKQKLLGRFSL